MLRLAWKVSFCVHLIFVFVMVALALAGRVGLFRVRGNHEGILGKYDRDRVISLPVTGRVFSLLYIESGRCCARAFGVTDVWV